MPELPEVETIRRQLVAVHGARVIAASTDSTPRFRAGSDVIGTLGEPGRAGKWLIVPFTGIGGARELVIHLGMTGKLTIDTDPPHWRCRWELDSGVRLTLADTRGFGRVDVVSPGDYRTIPGLYRLGPEPWAMDPGMFTATVGRAGAPIKARLLDQHVIAGIGNIYADEALWRAGIDPRARRVGPHRARRLLGHIADVLDEAIIAGGSSIRDYVHADGSAGTMQQRLQCYGRAGEPCLRCGALLKRTMVAGRGTTYCPRCQRS